MHNMRQRRRTRMYLDFNFCKKRKNNAWWASFFRERARYICGMDLGTGNPSGLSGCWEEGRTIPYLVGFVNDSTKFRKMNDITLSLTLPHHCHRPPTNFITLHPTIQQCRRSLLRFSYGCTAFLHRLAFSRLSVVPSRDAIAGDQNSYHLIMGSGTWGPITVSWRKAGVFLLSILIASAGFHGV